MFHWLLLQLSALLLPLELLPELQDWLIVETTARLLLH
jgi:hypothetical protein